MCAFGITNLLPLEGPTQSEVTNRLRYPESYQLMEPKFIKTHVKCYKHVLTLRADDSSFCCCLSPLKLYHFVKHSNYFLHKNSSAQTEEACRLKCHVAQSSRILTVFQRHLFLSLSQSSNSTLMVQEQVTPDRW